jgi:hypothetical protein
MRNHRSLTQECGQWALAIEAWWEMLRAAIFIRIPWGRQKLIQRAMICQEIADRESETDTILKAVNRARRLHLKVMSCLEHSLALVWMLRRRNSKARLQIGCRRDGSDICFHAWVLGPNSKPLEISENFKAFAPLSFASCRSGGEA